MSNHNTTIAMPNEIIWDLIKWSSTGKLKSVQHREFVYCYYWYIAFLWRTAAYADSVVDQRSIKRKLGYNENEKRIDYIIKKGGLLDKCGYTKAVSDYPVGWIIDGEDLFFSMYSDYDKISRGYLPLQITGRTIIKAPLKHLGSEEEEGIFWNSQNTHLITSDIFEMCMNNSKLGRAGFYMFGILVSMRDKNRHYSGEGFFKCSNETLVKLTGWDIKKVTSVTNSLVDAGLISKEQRFKIKGDINCFEVR